jgi:hypothetical protein
VIESVTVPGLVPVSAPIIASTILLLGIPVRTGNTMPTNPQLTDSKTIPGEQFIPIPVIDTAPNTAPGTEVIPTPVIDSTTDSLVLIDPGKVDSCTPVIDSVTEGARVPVLTDTRIPVIFSATATCVVPAVLFTPIPVIFSVIDTVGNPILVLIAIPTIPRTLVNEIPLPVLSQSVHR